MLKGVKMLKCEFCGKDFLERNLENGNSKKYCNSKCRSYENMLHWLLKKKNKGQQICETKSV